MRSNRSQMLHAHFSSLKSNMFNSQIHDFIDKYEDKALVGVFPEIYAQLPSLD